VTGGDAGISGLGDDVVMDSRATPGSGAMAAQALTLQSKIANLMYQVQAFPDEEYKGVAEAHSLPAKQSVINAMSADSKRLSVTNIVQNPIYQMFAVPAYKTPSKETLDEIQTHVGGWDDLVNTLKANASNEVAYSMTQAPAVRPGLDPGAGWFQNVYKNVSDKVGTIGAVGLTIGVGYLVLMSVGPAVGAFLGARSSKR